MRERLLLGLLGCDVVAFHTRADARAFVLCAQELLGPAGRPEAHDGADGGRTVRVRAYPISIDIPALEEIAHTDASDEHLLTLDQGLHGGQLLLRVDRTDPSKNIVRGFLAYDLLLTEHPSCTARCSSWRCCSPAGRTCRSTPPTWPRSAPPPPR
jgi:trehalose 6-phosphate synthase